MMLISRRKKKGSPPPAINIYIISTIAREENDHLPVERLHLPDAFADAAGVKRRDV